VKTEIATYRRLRSALRAAREADTVTELVGSSELNLLDASRYAQNYMLLEGLHDVWIAQRVGRLQIGPERRTSLQRRSGVDRRSHEPKGGLWAEKRINPDRRTGAERRVPVRPVWEAA
jgi:hypothetical protein